MIFAPLVMPEVITGLSLLLLFVAIGFDRGFWTVTIAHITFSMCYAAVVVQARLSDFDKSVEEAAMDLGASPVGTFFQITLPIIAPSVISAWLLSFTLSLDDLVIASFATGPGATTLPMKIYSQVRLGVTPEINAISTIMIGVVTLGVLVASYTTKQAVGPRAARKTRGRCGCGLATEHLVERTRHGPRLSGADLCRTTVIMAQEHAPSYYAATANDETRYPPLEGVVKADVCVVGGGFSGVATALTMAERGYSVVLLEANRIGWGASGRNGGQMIFGMSGEETIRRQLGEAGARLLREIRYRGHEIIEERVRKYKISCDLKHGWMEAAARPRHLDGMRAFYEQMVADGHGDHFELVEPGDMGRVLGTDAYHGGIIDRRSGHLHPLNLVLGEARAAAGLGAKIHEDSKVIELIGGAKPVAVTAGGQVEAATIVLAGNTDHPFQRGRLFGYADADRELYHCDRAPRRSHGSGHQSA